MSKKREEFESSIDALDEAEPLPNEDDDDLIPFEIPDEDDLFDDIYEDDDEDDDENED